MGNKMDYASGPLDVLDLSIADPADRQILDEHVVSDILKSGSDPLPDQSMGDGRDGMDDMDETVLSRTDVVKPGAPTNEADSASKDAGSGDTTSRIRRRVMMEEITEGTTMQHRYQPETVRVSSVRRLLNWFMRRFWQSDLR